MSAQHVSWQLNKSAAFCSPCLPESRHAADGPVTSVQCRSQRGDAGVGSGSRSYVVVKTSGSERAAKRKLCLERVGAPQAPSESAAEAGPSSRFCGTGGGKSTANQMPEMMIPPPEDIQSEVVVASTNNATSTTAIFESAHMDMYDGFQTPTPKQGRKRRVSTMSMGSCSSMANTPGVSSPSDSPHSVSRTDNSLTILTKKFMQMLESSPTGVVNLNDVSERLGVQKRRIYDITNVLEGIGMIEKVEKNSVQLKQNDPRSMKYDQECCGLQREIDTLLLQEREIESLISRMQNALAVEMGEEENQNYAYINYKDLRAIQEFRDQTLIAIKAPPDSSLQVPDPKLTGEMKMWVRSSSGPIDVYLCPINESQPSQPKPPQPAMSVDTINLQGHTLHYQPQALVSPPAARPYQTRNMGDSKNACAGTSTQQSQQVTTDVGMVNANSDGFCPSGKSTSQAPLPHSPNGAAFFDDFNLQSFLPMDAAPLSSVCDSDYMFSLNPGEGLHELFDIYDTLPPGPSGPVISY